MTCLELIGSIWRPDAAGKGCRKVFVWNPVEFPSLPKRPLDRLRYSSRERGFLELVLNVRNQEVLRRAGNQKGFHSEDGRGEAIGPAWGWPIDAGGRSG